MNCFPQFIFEFPFLNMGTSYNMVGTTKSVIHHSILFMFYMKSIYS